MENIEKELNWIGDWICPNCSNDLIWNGNIANCSNCGKVFEYDEDEDMLMREKQERT